ncbi:MULTISPECIES: S26 family signal peptidase [Nocardiopsidaceae]|uniref:signal peptidase I n=2 Tax=Nocardiopsidaceae TaxID=83676 RepID=A0ABY6YRN4_9ACTN|nr:S26 family signal peptidase [Streptomonospora nanhaiensis]MEE2043923.1 S26 family signal peptidase [Nocardiopsis tropica]WAE75001.1 S26 family signal peptidase [Streptomonospora nanhaiensis]
MLTAIGAAVALALPAAALGALLWVRARVFVAVVSGESMLPTLRHGDRMLSARTHRGTVIAPRQLVVLSDPQTPVIRDERNRRRPNYLVKRVAAVAGDPLPRGVAGDEGGGTVPEGFVVVLGDNRDSSLDSRGFGPVPVSRVVGTVLRRLEG